MSAVSSSEVEVVIEFLRSNGFKEAESALMEDMMEKCDLGSFDYEKFLFPVLPPLRVSSSLRLPEVEDGADCSSRRLLKSSYDSTSSDDEFVSLESSTSGVCSSGFTNPYGARTSVSRGNSDASSDSLSQFGTARDYHDLEWQNEFYDHDEKNETYFLTPSFRGTDFFGCPSEDKFILSSESNKQNEESLVIYDKSEALESEASINYLDKPCLFNAPPRNDKNEVQVKETELNDFQSKNMCDSSDDYYLSLYSEIKKNYSYSSKRGSSNDWIEGIKGTSESNDKIPEKDFAEDGLVSYEAKEGEVNGGMFEPNTGGEVEDVVNEDHSEVDTHEDEYEVFNLRIIHRKHRTGFEENKDLPIVLNTVIAGQYYVTEYLGSAAFSKVFQAHDLHTGIDVCLKIIKNDKDFFDQSLDEIKLLKLVNKHDPGDQRHILRLYDYFYHQEHLFIVCELLRANLYEFQKFNLESGGEPYFTLNRLQVITRQCLEALEYLHGLGIIHCDLKPENILIKSYRRCEIKVIDLGSSCFRSDNLCLYVQSRSYRAPEVIIGLPYDQKIDLWSLGCILAELCSGEVLFPNDAVATILARIMGMLGPIDLDMLARGQETYKYFTKDYDLYFVDEETNQIEYIIPEESSLQNHLQVSDALFIDFITTLLEINPQRRPTAIEVLKHPWLSYAY